MKRTALALTLSLAILISLMAGVMVVNVAKANPFLIFEVVPPIPGTIPPVITVSSIENNTAYASNNVHISFNISKPQPPIAFDTGLTSVSYTLDNHHTARAHYRRHFRTKFGVYPRVSLMGYSAIILDGNLGGHNLQEESCICFSLKKAVFQHEVLLGSN